MIMDAQLQLSSAQALTVTAASTNYIDFGIDGNVGMGEPMVAVITVGTALAGTSPTFQAAVQFDSSSGFGTAINAAQSQSYSALAAGAKVIVPIPEDTTGNRYCRLNYTLGGTSPTITVTAELLPAKMVQSDIINYAKNYSIT